MAETAARWPSAEIAALIPAYKPSDGLRDIVGELRETGCETVVVVDDGSGAEFSALFTDIAAMSGVDLVTHPENLGKGAALKTGMVHLLDGWPDLSGVVTLDADGQHRIPDVVRVAAALHAEPDAIVLGARQFDDKSSVPLRSRLGNSVTRFIFRQVYGGEISDTQTGLRGLPGTFLPTALRIPSQRYDYELDMLIQGVTAKRRFVSVPIETVYIDDNASSHFNPVLDSLRIYFSLFRFSISALTAFVLDNLVFYIALVFTSNIAASLAIGRVLATTVNFLMNRSFVFRHNRRFFFTLAKYLLLVVFLATLSYSLILLLTELFGLPAIVAKLMAEGGLFVLSFLAQRHIVFASRDDGSD